MPGLGSLLLLNEVNAIGRNFTVNTVEYKCTDVQQMYRSLGASEADENHGDYMLDASVQSLKRHDEPSDQIEAKRLFSVVNVLFKQVEKCRSELTPVDAKNIDDQQSQKVCTKSACAKNKICSCADEYWIVYTMAKEAKENLQMMRNLIQDKAMAFNENGQCCICQDDFASDTTTTHCMHKFCSECIMEWKRCSASPPKCPLCMVSLAQAVTAASPPFQSELTNISMYPEMGLEEDPGFYNFEINQWQENVECVYR